MIDTSPGFEIYAPLDNNKNEIRLVYIDSSIANSSMCLSTTYPHPDIQHCHIHGAVLQEKIR